MKTPFKTINDELHKVGNWLVANRLSLNIKKTEYMIFHTYHKNTDYLTSNITLNGNVLERVNTFNFQVAILDKHISSKAHVEMVSNKISKYCCILTKINNYLPWTYYEHYILVWYIRTWTMDCMGLWLQSLDKITKAQYSYHYYKQIQRTYKSVIESVRNIKLTWYVIPKYSQILLQIRA